MKRSRRQGEPFPPFVSFDVSLNGRHVCRTGLPGFGVLTTIVTWFIAKDGSGGLDLHVGGLNSDTKEHVRWLDDPPLVPGDEVCIQVLETGPRVDPPARAFKSDPDESLRDQLEYLLRLQDELRPHLVDPSAFAEGLLQPTPLKLLGVSPGDSFDAVSGPLSDVVQTLNPTLRITEVASVNGDWGMHVRTESGKILYVWSLGVGPELQSEHGTVRVGDSVQQIVAILGRPPARSRKARDGTATLHYPESLLAIRVKDGLATGFYLGREAIVMT